MIKNSDMEKLIYKVTKPYVYEMLIASAIDLICAIIAYVIVLAYYPKEYLFSLVFASPFLLIPAVKYAPLLIKCLLDRKKQTVVEKTGVYFDTDFDFPRTNWFTNKIGNESLLTTWYYPKEWNMQKEKLMFRTPEGKVFKPRCVLSYAHGQQYVFMDIRGMQKDFDEPILLKVKYLKYSKAIISIQMVSYPPNMKRRTKDYIDKNLSDLHRWSTKS